MGTLITPPVAARLREDFLAAFSDNTFNAYKNDLNAFARFMGSDEVDVALSDLLRLQAASAEKLATKYKESLAGVKQLTFRRRLSTLRNFSKFAQSQGAISWALALPPRVLRTKGQKKSAMPKDMSGPPEKMILGLRERLATSASLDAWRDIAIIDLHFYRGLRVSELVGLDVDDVDLKRKIVIIQGKARSVAEELVINDRIVASIKKWMSVRPGPKKGPLFIRLDAAVKNRNQYTRLTRTGLFLKFRGYGKEIGHPFRPHGLRHTSITSLVERTAKHGIPLTTVQKFARHATFATTASYVNKSGMEDRVAMNLLPK